MVISTIKQWDNQVVISWIGIWKKKEKIHFKRFRNSVRVQSLARLPDRNPNFMVLTLMVMSATAITYNQKQWHNQALII